MMSIERDSVEAADEPVECVVVWPHRSLGRHGVCLLLASVGTVFALLCLGALTTGAWPTVVYVLLAAIGMAWALRCNTQAGRVAQIIELGPTRIRVTESGRAARRHEAVEFTPGWVRVVDVQGPWAEKRFFLRQSGRSIAIGDFLPPDERAEFADALRTRLAQRYRASVQR